MQRSPKKDSGVKANPIVKIGPRFPQMNEDLMARALQTAVWPIGKTQGVLTVKEIAAAIGRAESTAYHIIENGNPSGVQLAQISKALAERGDFSLLEMQLPEGFAITPTEEQEVDGSLLDEVTDNVEDMGTVVTLFNKGDFKGARKKIAEMKSNTARMEAEISAKERGKR